MNDRQALDKLLEALPENRLREVLDFAQFLTWQEERESWRRFAQGQIARAYGSNEPEYTAADLQSFER